MAAVDVAIPVMIIGIVQRLGLMLSRDMVTSPIDKIRQ